MEGVCWLGASWGFEPMAAARPVWPLGRFLPSQLLTRVQEIVAPSAHGTVEG